MGGSYSQLDLDDRIELSGLLEDGKAQSEIARIMGRHRSTIKRELERNNLPKSGYKPGSADRMAFVRRQRLSRLERLNPLGDHVRDHLAMGWSPEQISGRLRLERSEHFVSHETIYRFIYRAKVKPEKLYRYLPRAKASRGRRYFKRRREPIPGRRSIHERPQHIENRHEFGHWEGDLMQFRTQRGNLATLCERKTRFSLAAPLKSKKADETRTVLERLLAPLPAAARRSLTFDRGTEFAEFRALETHLSLLTYFCDPHSPWQRGTIENTNGLYRRDMPRKTDITNYTAQDIEDLTWALNSTPRKCLGFKTPAEAFLQNLKPVALEM
jgi:IS30 family transposase